MTKSADVAPAAQSGADAETKGGFVRDWVLPILLGLVIGGAAVGAWRLGLGGLFHSKAWNVVQKWQYDDSEANDLLTKDLRALGPAARADLVSALRDLPAEQIEVKIWLAHQLAGEPWFDTTSLKEIVRDAKASKEDRRAAACALVDTQSKEVDTELVLPVFEEWMQDSAAPDHGYAITRIDRMWRAGMFSSAWEGRVKRVLVDEVKRRAAAKPDDQERLTEDRAYALLALGSGMPDDDIKKLFWSVAKDETDESLPRINAIRSLSETHVTDAADVDDWAAVAKAGDGIVRQGVADNLFRAQAPVYDKVLEPLQFDAMRLTRTGAIDAQIKRRRPTMLARFDELVEDSYEWARFNAIFAAGVFKSETEGLAQRAAIMLRLIETSDDTVDVMGAVLAMKMLTDEVNGFRPDEVRVHEQAVDETALAAFMADKAGRKQAADKWRAHFGAGAVWTDGDRRKTLEKLLKHADPDNAARAQRELDAMK